MKLDLANQIQIEEISLRQKLKNIMDPEKNRNSKFFHFMTLYTESYNGRPTLNGLEFSMLKQQDWAVLEREFLEEEILEGLMHCKRDKALDPDGFNMNFLQKFWSMLKGDILELFREF